MQPRVSMNDYAGRPITHKWKLIPCIQYCAEKHTRSQVAFQVLMDSVIFPAAFCWLGKIKTLLSITGSSDGSITQPLKCSHIPTCLFTLPHPPIPTCLFTPHPATSYHPTVFLYKRVIRLTLVCWARFFVLHFEAIRRFFRNVTIFSLVMEDDPMIRRSSSAS